MQNEAAINPKHLCKCRDELSNLNFLVSTGLMNPLPNDKVITKLLLHAMSLEMQSISSGLGKLYDFDMVSYEDGPLRLWKHSDPSITSEFICDDREPVSLEINGISKCCLDLVSAWRNNLPAGRARTKRFNRAIDGCISQLEKYAMEQGGNNKEGTDDFAAAFGRQTEPGDNGGATAKAYLKVFQGEVNRRSFGGSTTRISMDDVLSVSSSPPINLSTTLSLTTQFSQVWKVVATTKLLASQERILHRSCGCSLAPGDSYHQMNALIGKIIYDSIMNLIQTLATTDGVNNTSSVDRPEARVISCWAALLESVSSGQNQVSSLRDEKISDESLAFCYWTCQISFACRHAIDSLHSQQRETMVIIAKSMFEMTTGPLAAYFVRLLNITDQNSARMCLRSCLASLRSLSSLLAVAKTKPAVESQSPTESDNAEEDLFGDIDDEAFLALEMPDQSTAYEAMEPAATLWKHFSTLLKLSKVSVDLL